MANVYRQMQLGFVVMPAALALQLLATLLLAGHLGPALFGVFSVIFAIMSVATFVTEMGVGSIVTKLVAEQDHAPARIVALGLPLVTVLCGLAGILQIGIGFAAYDDSAARWSSLIAAGNIFCFGGSMVLSAALRGRGEMGKWMLGFFGQKLVFLILVLAVVKPLGGGLMMSVGAWTAATVVATIYYLASAWGRVWRAEICWDVREIWDVFKPTVPISLISAAKQLAMQIDLFILAALVSDHSLGLYAVGQRLINPACNILQGAVSTPSFPALCRAANSDPAEFARQSTQLCVVQWVAGLTLALVGWCAAVWVVPILLTDAFADSIPIVQVMVWALPAACVAMQLRFSFIALSKQNTLLALNLAHLGAKAVLLAILTWRFDVWGACYGMVVAELLLVLLVRIGIAALGVRMDFEKRVAIPTVATAAAVLALLWLSSYPWLSAVLTAAFAVCAVYVVNHLLRDVRHRQPQADSGANEEAAPQ